MKSWKIGLFYLLNPKINFRFYELKIDDLPVVMLEIDAAFRHPVQFKNQRIHSCWLVQKETERHGEERELWRVFDQTPFESQVAAENIPAEDVLRLLDYPALL